MKLTIPEMMLKEMDKLIKTHDFQEYINYGFKIEFIPQKCELNITYKQKQYVITLVNKDEQFYWHLVPYNNSFYETAIDNGLTIVLFAIKENEELYEKKGN